MSLRFVIAVVIAVFIGPIPGSVAQSSAELQAVRILTESTRVFTCETAGYSPETIILHKQDSDWKIVGGGSSDVVAEMPYGFSFRNELDPFKVGILKKTKSGWQLDYLRHDDFSHAKCEEGDKLFEQLVRFTSSQLLTLDISELMKEVQIQKSRADQADKQNRELNALLADRIKLLNAQREKIRRLEKKITEN